MPLRLSATLLGCLAATWPAWATTPAATLRFGTACAHCHEGECSGRLSFAQPPEATFVHIRQYAGPADDALARQLYETLEQMKSDCRYPAVTVPALDRSLTSEDLRPYLDPWSGDYFLPLGRLEPGDYDLAVEFTGAGQVRVEVIDDEFDPLIDRCVRLEQQRLAVAFAATHDHQYYLRLRPRGPLQVRTLTMTRVG